MAELEGVSIPLTTPFRGDDVAPDRLAANLERWNATALAGYVALGSNGLKAALDRQDFVGGPCRAPLGTPDGDAIEDIKDVLATAGLP